MTSREYWRKREAEALEHYITEEAEYSKRINEIYDYMLDNISKEINGFYTKYAKSEKISMAEAKKRASKLDMEEYSRKAKKYVENKDFSDNANAEMKLYNLTMKVNRLELLKANIGLEMVDGFDDLEKHFGEILDTRAIDEFKRQAGILGESIGDNAKAANAIVNASFSNAKFSDRIWMYQGMLKNELSSLLATGLIQGKHPNELSRHLQKLFGVQKQYADRLMRTELCRVQTEAQKQSYERGGYGQYMFITTHDSKTCTICRPLDGQIFSLKDMQAGENAPPMHPNCRCSTAAYMDRAEVEKQITSMEKSNEKHLRMNLQFFAKNSKDEINKKINSGLLDRKKFDECLKYFKDKFKQGIYTPVGTVYDKKNAFYHIIDRHDYMMSKTNIDRIVNTLSAPKAIFNSKDSFGMVGQAYIEDNAEKTLLVIVRSNIITAYEPSKSYLKKIEKGAQIWKKP